MVGGSAREHDRRLANDGVAILTCAGWHQQDGERQNKLYARIWKNMTPLWTPAKSPGTGSSLIRQALPQLARASGQVSVPSGIGFSHLL